MSPVHQGKGLQETHHDYQEQESRLKENNTNMRKTFSIKITDKITRVWEVVLDCVGHIT